MLHRTQAVNGHAQTGPCQSSETSLTSCRLGNQRRRILLFAWLTLFCLNTFSSNSTAAGHGLCSLFDLLVDQRPDPRPSFCRRQGLFVPQNRSSEKVVNIPLSEAASIVSGRWQAYWQEEAFFIFRWWGCTFFSGDACAAAGLGGGAGLPPSIASTSD